MGERGGEGVRGWGLALFAGTVLGTGIGSLLGVRWAAAGWAGGGGAGEEREAALPGPKGERGEASDGALAMALLALEGRLASLEELLRQQGASGRRAAGEGWAPPADPEGQESTLVAALGRLTEALEESHSRARTVGTAGVRMTSRPTDEARLRELVQRDYQEVQVEHAFWSVQQVLDTYGRPTYVRPSHLEYQVGEPEPFTVSFRLGATGFVEAVQF